MSDESTAGSIMIELAYVAVTVVAMAVVTYGVKRVSKKVKTLRAAKS